MAGSLAAISTPTTSPRPSACACSSDSSQRGPGSKTASDAKPPDATDLHLPKSVTYRASMFVTWQDHGRKPANDTERKNWCTIFYPAGAPRHASYLRESSSLANLQLGRRSSDQNLRGHALDLFRILGDCFRAPIKAGSSVPVRTPFPLQSLFLFGSGIATAAAVLAGAPVNATPPVVIVHRHNSPFWRLDGRAETARYISAKLRQRVLNVWTGSYLNPSIELGLPVPIG
jgi:hypothetical protein